jgi:VIT1/CCC1 family predicted Fe2+/Mn2+ transporter
MTAELDLPVGPHEDEPHQAGLNNRLNWLRAAVLGANDGIVSTASLVIGIAAAQSDRRQILVAGVAGLVAGAMSMAAGEYVSVSSQADTEQADLEIERAHLEADPDYERDELAGLYVARGLDPEMALNVAEQLMAHDALGAHARDELGLSKITAARPLQAALASAAAFALGAILPVLVVVLAPTERITTIVTASALVLLAVLGAVAAKVGGASTTRGALRVAFWGVLAMGASALVGRAFGTTVA